MLKKAGTVVAIVAVGLLVLNPAAYAGEGKGKGKHVHQSNSQSSNQGNGVGNGNNIGSGNAAQLCGININGLNNVIGAIGGGNVNQNSQVVQGGANCANNSVAIGQNTNQQANNNNGD